MSTRNYKSSTITVAAAVVVQASLKSRTSSNPAPKEPGSQPRARKPPPVQILAKHSERDADFWYSDGNIVIRVEARLFKVHRSRLSKHCAYFRKLFAAETDATLSAKGGMVDSCPVHRLPTNLSAPAFKQFLIALETPLAFVKNPPSEADAYAMLKASHTLSCPVIFNLAKDRLAQIWDSTAVPSEGTELSYQYAVPNIALFRRYRIPEFLKRAYYETLTDPEFWKALSRGRASIPTLSDTDLRVLYEARDALQRLWREFVVIPPRTCKDGVSTCAQPSRHFSYSAACAAWHMSSVQRSHIWVAFVVQNGQLEAGAGDPVRYNMIKTWRPALASEWCGLCLDEWEKAWLEKREQWWIQLDKLLKL